MWLIYVCYVHLLGFCYLSRLILHIQAKPVHIPAVVCLWCFPLNRGLDIVFVFFLVMPAEDHNVKICDLTIC